MKTLVRLFFRTLQIVLGPILLLREYLTRPRGLQRPPECQQQVDADCRGLSLYQFRTCPFCIRVRQEMRRLSVNIELLDAQKNEMHRGDLARGGGKLMVPCLRITDAPGEVRWLYESGQIIDYLRGRFGKA